mgnify:CR=1 FL=1
MPETEYTRRDVLKIAAGVAAGVAARLALSRFGPIGAALADSGPNGLQRTTDKKKDFPSPMNIDGIPIIGWNSPLSGEDLKRFEESTKGKESESPIRKVDLLISKKAIESWAKGEKGTGETLPQFIKKHLERLNQILKKTRPSSGISNLQVEPRLLVMDDDWLKAQNAYVRQISNCADAVGRFSIDSSYSPKDSAYFHNKYDDGLLHELSHYILFNQYHLWMYFERQKTWNEGLNTSKMREPIDKNGIKLWGLNNPDVQDPSDLLTSTSTRWGMSGSLLSEPDELCIRNSTVNGHKFRNWTDLSFREPETVFSLGSMATEYRFFAPGLEKSNPRLYIADVSSGDVREMVNSEIKSDPILLRADANGVIIPTDLVSGYSELPNTQKTVKVFLLIMDVNGEKRTYGFTSWHLTYWHWKEQIKNAEKGIGLKGKRYPANINLNEFTA